MALAMVERFDFSEDPGPSVTGDFIDYLDSKLLVSKQINARLNTSVRTFTQNNTGQFV